MATCTKDIEVRMLTAEEMDQIAGGHPFEDCFWDADLYRAGVSFHRTLFGSDEYFVGSTQIPKELARKLRERSRTVWKNYSASGDYYSYAREWKAILANEYNINWDGQIGTYEFQAW